MARSDFYYAFTGAPYGGPVYNESSVGSEDTINLVNFTSPQYGGASLKGSRLAGDRLQD